MYVMSKYFVIIFISLTLGCNKSPLKKHVEWQETRLNNLLQPYDWPSVIGLYPIEDSILFMGQSVEDGIIHPDFPDTLASIHLSKHGKITCSSKLENSLFLNQEPIMEVELKDDQHEQGPNIVSYKSFQFYIINREGNLFLRLKDSLSAYRQNLKSIPAYDFEEKYIIEAMVKKGDQLPKVVRYKNQLGQTLVNDIAAILEFEWDGEKHEVIALPNNSDSYFVILNDQTSGITTYGGGRFLYPKKANRDGKVILDFNRLINPPCVFTPYATCPLPPRENHLPFEILSGEKDFHLY